MSKFNFSAVLVILLSSMSAQQAVADDGAIQSNAGAESSASAKAINIRATFRTGLSDLNVGEMTSVNPGAAMNYIGLNSTFMVPANDAGTVNFFTTIDLNRVATSAETQTAVVPSMIVGVSNSIQCRWCGSLGVGAEKAAILNLSAYNKNLAGSTGEIFDRVALIKIQAEMGYRYFVGSWAVGPEVHYEWLQPRGLATAATNTASPGFGITATHRVCPKMRFDGQSGAVEHLGMAAVFCYEARSVNYYDNGGSISTAANSLGAELSYQF